MVMSRDKKDNPCGQHQLLVVTVIDKVVMPFIKCLLESKMEHLLERNWVARVRVKQDNTLRLGLQVGKVVHVANSEVI